VYYTLLLACVVGELKTHTALENTTKTHTSKLEASWCNTSNHSTLVRLMTFTLTMMISTTQDDSHTVVSTVSVSTSHDWNNIPGNRTSTSESGVTRSRTTSPARAASVPTLNQYDALSANPQATGLIESSSQESCVAQQALDLNVRLNCHYTPTSLRVSSHGDSTNEDCKTRSSILHNPKSIAVMGTP
jgi:hypothetical protein